MFLYGTIECPHCEKVIEYCGDVESHYLKEIVNCEHCGKPVELSGYVELIIDCAIKKEVNTNE